MENSLIELDKIEKGFCMGQEQIRVLSDLNFKAKKGQTTAILGRSGSGKSTLLSLMAGLDHPDSGKVIVAQTHLGALSESELSDFRSKNIGIIFQQFHLLPHLTALENVILALEISRPKYTSKERDERARKILEQVGLGHRPHHFPSMLSGGEKQRVAIARAISVGPRVLLADEPSGSLDEKTGLEVMDLIFRLVHESKTTLILVTHDQLLAKKCEQILELDRGRLK